TPSPCRPPRSSSSRRSPGPRGGAGAWRASRPRNRPCGCRLRRSWLEVDAAPAVHGEDLAGHERRVEEQVFYRAGHVVRAADAPKRGLALDTLFLGGIEMLAALGPEDRARRHAVHAHVRAQLEGEGAREPGEPGLRDR